MKYSRPSRQLVDPITAMSSRYLALLVVLTLAAGCSKLTAANYEKLRMGMTYAEVKGLLGEPDRCTDVLGAKHCVWGDEKKHISVNFVADQAILFAGENVR